MVYDYKEELKKYFSPLGLSISKLLYYYKIVRGLYRQGAIKA